jgi:hypothetical protein
MKHKTSRRPSPSMIVAIVALFFALAGTGIAASRYLITSTSQIKPSVLRELRRTVAHVASEKPSPSGAVAVVARARSVAAVATGSVAGPVNGEPEESTGGMPGETNDPLAGATWTQHPEELAEITGTASITSPARANCGRGSSGTVGGLAGVAVYIDGKLAGWTRGAPLEAKSTSFTTVSKIFWDFPDFPSMEEWLLEPGSATKHTLSVTAWDTCGREGGASGAHFTVNSVSLDVIGFR